MDILVCFVASNHFCGTGFFFFINLGAFFLLGFCVDKMDFFSTTLGTGLGATLGLFSRALPLFGVSPGFLLVGLVFSLTLPPPKSIDDDSTVIKPMLLRPP